MRVEIKRMRDVDKNCRDIESECLILCVDGKRIPRQCETRVISTHQGAKFIVEFDLKEGDLVIT